MASRHRTYWIVRNRYRRGGYLASIASLLLAAFFLVPLVHGADVGGTAMATTSPLLTGGILLVAAILPPLVARVLWRFHRRRYLDDLYPLSLV